mgnify:FL=1
MEREVSMQAEITWLDDPEVFRVNQMPAHSDHLFYADEEECRRGESSLYQSLNGMWQFCYSENASGRPKDFYREDFDAGSFDEIRVPGHIELAGYDKIQYINVMYPWEGQDYRRPAGTPSAEGQRKDLFSGAVYNPVGSYRRTFDLPEAMKGKRISLFFEGVEQAVYVWLNGIFIGYAEDSFTPSEFDLTEVVRDTGNILAVEVHKRSTAAFLEDQDFFRFFGIFRNVSLIARPKLHLEDIWIRPLYEPEDGTGELRLRMKFSGDTPGGRAEVTVSGAGEQVLSEAVSVQDAAEAVWKMPGTVKPWDNHQPFLYQMELRLYDREGTLTEVVPYEFGFRKIELRDKVICLNGKRVIFCGVNRHEWSAESGRCIGREEMEWDMACMKHNEINAVRTCHYPDQIPWYGMCDRNGIYMIAETNLETHGSWQKWGNMDVSWNLPGSFPAWKEVTLDRARSNFEVFKNHTAVLMWSLGNESYVGDVLEEMNRLYKEWDPDRLVHYESVIYNRDYEDTVSDIECRMYAPPEAVRAYLDKDPKKPFVLSEFMHCMGNSVGGLVSYMDLLDEHEMYQGGFIWDFIDQALFVTDEVTGKKVLRYGADFDERPADYEFSGDGIVFADRREKPAVQEVRYLYGKYR